MLFVWLREREEQAFWAPGRTLHWVSPEQPFVTWICSSNGFDGRRGKTITSLA